jgi:hypothetical protein
VTVTLHSDGELPSTNFLGSAMPPFFDDHVPVNARPGAQGEYTYHDDSSASRSGLQVMQSVIAISSASGKAGLMWPTF